MEMTCAKWASEVFNSHDKLGIDEDTLFMIAILLYKSPSAKQNERMEELSTKLEELAESNPLLTQMTFTAISEMRHELSSALGTIHVRINRARLGGAK